MVVIPSVNRGRFVPCLTSFTLVVRERLRRMPKVRIRRAERPCPQGLLGHAHDAGAVTGHGPADAGTPRREAVLDRRQLRTPGPAPPHARHVRSRLPASDGCRRPSPFAHGQRGRYRCGPVGLGVSPELAVLRVVHVWTEPPGNFRRFHGMEFHASLARRQATALTEALRPWRRKFPGVDVIESSRCGSAAQVLVDASRDASLAVVGRRIRTCPLGTHIGHVTHAVLHHVVAPVAVVAHGY
ncbi:universal stress protein [Streptomyces sp. NPDC013157]|uniref:universal stress protein n=1 Tax=Streptomyces sp. NPDC013157 TaxID=3364861 RepID=UPI0036CBFE1B